MSVGEALLELARARDAHTVAVVGTAKNVGKTVTIRALYEAAVANGVPTGVLSAGRDGEAIDAVTRDPKPRLRLEAGTWIASALRTPHPLRDVGLPCGVTIPTACGPVLVGCVEEADDYELVGPPTVSGLRVAVDALREKCELVLIDGAIDRLAAISSGEDAVIVACGAAGGATLEEIVDDVRALVERLRIPPVDPQEPAMFVEGALLPELASELLSSGEQRQIVVRSPASVSLSGRLAQRALAELHLRCEHPVQLLAATVAPSAGRKALEPQRLLEAVAQATALPTYDVYTGSCAKPSAWSR